MENNHFSETIQKYKQDSERVYNGNLPIQYIVFGELRDNCDAICRLDDSHKVMNRIAKCC